VPARRRRGLHPQPGHHTRPDAGGDPRDQLTLQQPELGGPRRGAGLHREFPVPQRHRLGMLGELRAHQLRPFGKHHTGGDLVHPATIGHQPGRQPTQRLRVPVVSPRTGPAATSTRPRPLATCPATRGPTGTGPGGAGGFQGSSGDVGTSGPVRWRLRGTSGSTQYRLVHTIHRFVPSWGVVIGPGVIGVIGHDAPARHAHRTAHHRAPRAHRPAPLR
jgi:hypothetical protein